MRSEILSNPENLKIGLEIHLQLKGEKLFCRCSTELSEEVRGSVWRKLRTVSGEMGITDRAAVYEGERNRNFRYEITPNSCLVELDEEPPGRLNPRAMETALLVSLGLHSRIADAIQVMRKIVIDGSNTSGFQRTALISSGGFIESGSGRIGISSVCLEEDSARKVQDGPDSILYSLDRLGMPLLEIATDPDIKTPESAAEVARDIGFLAKEISMLRRGADSIRQDVNMSIGYGRVEIKGVSKISQILEVVRYEIARQIAIGKAVATLKSRIEGEYPPVSSRSLGNLRAISKSKKLADAQNSGMEIRGGKLPGLKGLLRSGDMRLGREIAEVLRAFGIGGMIHSDELPGYGLEQEDLQELSGFFACGADDAFFIIAMPKDRSRSPDGVITDRIRKMASLDLSETRGPTDAGETYFLRPLPGRERMYPETDLPIVVPDPAVIRKLGERTPVGMAKFVSNFANTNNISSQDASTIADKDLITEFGLLKDAAGDARLAVRILLQTIPEMSRKSRRQIDVQTVGELLTLGRNNGWPKYALENAVMVLFNTGRPPEEIAKMEDVKPITGEELRKTIDQLRKDGKVSGNNLIFVLRKSTSRPFDPSEAMSLVANLN